MQRVYIVWDIDYDENDRALSKLIDGIYDSEEKAIQGIQKSVRQVRRICEKLGGPKDHVTYLIDHVPTEEAIKRNEGVYYQKIDNCWERLTYEAYTMM